MVGNLKFPHTFVYTPANTALLLDDTKLPSELAENQVGIFNADTGKGVTQAQAAATPRIFIAQKLGDNKFGVKKTPVIDRDRLIHIPEKGAIYASSPKAAVDQVSYIGYSEDGVYTAADNDTRKNLKVLRTNKDVVLFINLYSQPLSRWYSVVPYQHAIVINENDVPADANDATIYDPKLLAEAIIGHLNGTIGLIDGFAETHELSEYLTASLVQNGDGGAGGPIVYGVKIAAKPVPEQKPDPNWLQKAYELKQTTFTIVKRLDYGQWTVTDKVKPVFPQGTALQTVEWELESQGYEGHTRGEMFDHPKFQAKVPYVTYAVAGTTYDGYFINFNYSHDTGVKGATNGQITEGHLAALFVPNNTGVALEAFLNAWSGAEIFAKAVDVDAV